jgi:chromosome partitioning protein
MQTIVFNSRKGGSGKTTLSAHLAVEAERVGDGPVFLIDTDPQGTLTMWHQKRVAETPQRIEISFARLPAALSKLKTLDAAFCLIDTPPTRDQRLESLFALADLTVVPIRPSAADLWAASDTVAHLKAHGHPFLFVLNQVKTRSVLTAQAASVLAHYGPVASTHVTDRVAYAAAINDGLSATELTRPRSVIACQEMAALWSNIRSLLAGRKQVRVIVKKQKEQYA